MVAKNYQKSKGSSKAEVGEIDTSAPFQSVKDAVSLFGEGAFSGEKPAIKRPKPQSAERLLAKETQLHLVQKEVSKLKEQVKNAETSKAEALIELEIAKRTVDDLGQKLESITESKDSAIRATELAKHQAKQFAVSNDNTKGTSESSNLDLETARVKHMAAFSELDAAKKELRRILQERNAFVEAKDFAAKQATKAGNAAEEYRGRVGALSKEIADVQDSIQQVKLAITLTKDEEAKIVAEKESQKQSSKEKLQESAYKLHALKKDINPEVTNKLEAQLGETLSEIQSLRKEMENTRDANLGSLSTVSLELDGAKESLNKVAEEENSLRRLVEMLTLELDNTKKEHLVLKGKEAETESIAGDLHVKLQKAKSELVAALAEEAKVLGASDEMMETINQLNSESEIAKREALDMKQKAEELKREAEEMRIELEEAEKKLKIAMHEAEEARAAEIRALDQIKMLSDKADAARSSTSEPGAQITISRDEFNSLSRKVEEAEKLAEMKVAAAIAQVDAVKASENQALKKLEATQKEIDDIRAATQEALKRAEMAEAAKMAVEGELRRRREQEQRAAEAASRLLAQSEKPFQSPPLSYRVQKQRPQAKIMETRRLEKAKTAVAKKVLMPSLSGMFHKKKNKVEGGSPSYLPGEKPVW